MNKELQDYAWQNCLPKEFKEEVKKDYKHAVEHDYAERQWLFEHIFGHHNLTSDAEGEEMLTVRRKKVQELFEEYKNMITPATGPVDKAAYGGVLLALQELFGSKCLPDEVDNLENKLRFEIGNLVVFHPFKTDSFYDAKIIEIKEGEDKPYLLQCGDKQIWAYPIEVQSIAETYPPKEKICDNPLADKEGCKHRNNERCSFDNACYFEPLNPQEPKPAEPKCDLIIRVIIENHG